MQEDQHGINAPHPKASIIAFVSYVDDGSIYFLLVSDEAIPTLNEWEERGTALIPDHPHV
jgi:hypothetical protein